MLKGVEVDPLSDVEVDPLSEVEISTLSPAEGHYGPITIERPLLRLKAHPNALNANLSNMKDFPNSDVPGLV